MRPSRLNEQLHVWKHRYPWNINRPLREKGPNGVYRLRPSLVYKEEGYTHFLINTHEMSPNGYARKWYSNRKFSGSAEVRTQRFHWTTQPKGGGGKKETWQRLPVKGGGRYTEECSRKNAFHSSTRSFVYWAIAILRSQKIKKLFKLNIIIT